MKEILINGQRFVFRDPTKREWDTFENKWKYTQFIETSFNFAASIDELEKRVENGQLTRELAENLIELKTSIYRKWYQENYNDNVNGLSWATISTAERMALCIAEPKKTVEEWLETETNLFDQLSLELTKFLTRHLHSSYDLLNRFKEMLSTYPKEIITIKELLELLNGLEKDTLKKKPIE